jgi:hypothetical protein
VNLSRNRLFLRFFKKSSAAGLFKAQEINRLCGGKVIDFLNAA